MNKNPKVSVIIPVYNGEEYLPMCLDSVVNQTLADIEIFCVDDGSTDRTPEILKQYAQQDSRIRIITQKNGGAGAARNNALQYVTGEYLSILDADDFFEKDMLEKAYAKVKETDSDIVVFRCNLYRTPKKRYAPSNYTIKNELLPVTQPFAGTDIQKNAFRVFIGWAWDKLFRTEFIKEHGFYFQEQRTSNDLLFVFSAVISAKKIVTMDDILVHHRRGIESLSVTREKSWHCYYDALIALRNNLREMGLYSRFEDDFINYSAHFSLWNLETLAMPQKAMLFNKLHSEWLAELGVADYPMEKFYDVKEYCKCRRILYRQPIEDGVPRIKVSVVLPSLNVAPYIRECIESAIHQTMKEIEIICVDAGSTDGTLEVLEEYARKDSRVKVLKSPVKNYGYQMNMGLDAAQGEYFAILEADDCIKPRMYEELYWMASENYLDIIKPDFQSFIMDGDNRKVFTKQSIIYDSSLLKYNIIYDPKNNLNTFRCMNNIWSGLYDLGFLKANQIRFNESPSASYQDDGFFFLTMCHARRIVFLNRSYYMLRQDNPNSSVHNRGTVYRICDEYDYIRSQLKKNPAIENRFAPVLALYRFKNYAWNYKRIGDEFKDEFLERFSQDFQKIMAAGEIKREYFNMEETLRLRMILNTPQAYKYYMLAEEKRKIANEEKAVSVYSSGSSNATRLKAQLSAKIHGGIKCLSDNGWRYTLGRVLVHIGLAKDTNSSKNVEYFPTENALSSTPLKNSTPRSKTLMLLRRKLNGGIKCLREHGLRYTFRRLLFHLKLTRRGETIDNSTQSIISGISNYFPLRDIYPAELAKWYEYSANTRLELNSANTPQPSFSIIIPFFNAKTTIKRCLDSVKNQSYQWFEVICVDDGSTDDSADIVTTYLSDSRFHLLRQDNAGPGVARNNAMKHAKNDYIVFLDADDLLSPDALAYFALAAINTSFQVAVTNIAEFKESEENATESKYWVRPQFVPLKPVVNAKEIYPFIFNVSIGAPCGKCFQREFLEKKQLEFPPFRKSEDFYVIHFAMLYAERLLIDRTVTYIKYENPDSLEHQKDRYPLENAKAIDYFLQKLKNEDFPDSVMQSFVNESLNRYCHNLQTLEEPSNFELLLSRFRESAKVWMGLWTKPAGYYYNRSNYMYALKVLGIENNHIQITPLPISKKDKRGGKPLLSQTEK